MIMSATVVLFFTKIRSCAANKERPRKTLQVCFWVQVLLLQFHHRHVVTSTEGDWYLTRPYERLKSRVLVTPGGC